MKKNKKETKYFVKNVKIDKNLKYYIKYFLALPLIFFYQIRLLFCQEKVINKKYKVSICAIFKNESLYLKEWIEYHKIVGIDHFYLYNNNSEDDFINILTPYIQAGIVTLIDWPYNQAQMESYHDCIEKYSNETEWFSFIDIDEFIVPNITDNVYDFLKSFKNKRPVIIAYWKMFGTSGKISRNTDNLVTEDFIVCWNKYSDLGKIFFNTSYTFDKSYKRNMNLNHYSWGNKKKKYIPPVNVFNKMCIFGSNPIPHNADINYFPLQINHYFSKTYDEYLQKKSRGDAYFKTNPHDIEYFYTHEMNNQTTDYRIYKYLIKLKIALKKY